MVPVCVYPAGASVKQPPGYYELSGKTADMASPLWGKLSPQVTDEGATAGHFPLIRRVPRHLPPKGEGFCVIEKRVRLADTPYLNSQLSTLNSPFPLRYFYDLNARISFSPH